MTATPTEPMLQPAYLDLLCQLDTVEMVRESVLARHVQRR